MAETTAATAVATLVSAACRLAVCNNVIGSLLHVRHRSGLWFQTSNDVITGGGDHSAASAGPPEHGGSETGSDSDYDPYGGVYALILTVAKGTILLQIFDA